MKNEVSGSLANPTEGSQGYVVPFISMPSTINVMPALTTGSLQNYSIHFSQYCLNGSFLFCAMLMPDPPDLQIVNVNVNSPLNLVTMTLMSNDPMSTYTITGNFVTIRGDFYQMTFTITTAL